MPAKPALSLAAVAGRRKTQIDLAVRLEEEGFDAVFSPSMGDGMSLIEAIALKTARIRLGTGIANIYVRHPLEYALAASTIHELSGGRFVFWRRRKPWANLPAPGTAGRQAAGGRA
jgi:alkanesulfonate monooxygenase SsuD/methylene tetrahydromethanopterin reductase-like flavin-dependent oxidoreductase (luciferase family)